mmetsp:Transcript_12015/g.48354  ORF Transcript_12015/g.48354 Transcript_12015/m.48354 type:complete len:377 (+) Transcript_12015:1379-2509(+)
MMDGAPQKGDPTPTSTQDRDPTRSTPATSISGPVLRSIDIVLLIAEHFRGLLRSEVVLRREQALLQRRGAAVVVVADRDVADGRREQQERHRDEHREQRDVDQGLGAGGGVVPHDRRQIRDERGAEVEPKHDDRHAHLRGDRHAVDQIIHVAHARPVPDAVQREPHPEGPLLLREQTRDEHAESAGGEPRREMQVNRARRALLERDLVAQPDQPADADGDPQHEERDGPLLLGDDVGDFDVRRDVRGRVDLAADEPEHRRAENEFQRIPFHEGALLLHTPRFTVGASSFLIRRGDGEPRRQAVYNLFGVHGRREQSRRIENSDRRERRVLREELARDEFDERHEGARDGEGDGVGAEPGPRVDAVDLARHDLAPRV